VLSGEGLEMTTAGVGEAPACKKGSCGAQVVTRVLNNRKNPATNPAITVPTQPHISLVAIPFDLPSWLIPAPLLAHAPERDLTGH
jgi:hypothetical protein